MKQGYLASEKQFSWVSSSLLGFVCKGAEAAEYGVASLGSDGKKIRS